MTMHVLQDKRQIDDARDKLVREGLSTIDTPIQRVARRLHLGTGIAVGDRLKSWDVDAALDFVRAHVDPAEPVADIGSYASEVIVGLHRAGFTNLVGIDLNPALGKMPHADVIRYEISDFTKTNLREGSFKAITSISVIEHGFNARALLAEMSRLLQPGGYFFASFDYWPEKIDTSGITFFGMSWLIFSRDDVAALIEVARDFGLEPQGELSFESGSKPIDCGGKKYTFAYLVLRKKTHS